MPITGKQFDETLDETESKIVDFLSEHPDKAFDINEVAEAICPPAEAIYPPAETKIEVFAQALATALGIASALDGLVRQRLVDKKTRYGKVYYRIHQGS